jgi:hypothetical protein
VATAAQRAIEYFLATAEKIQHLLDHDRGVVRGIPPSGHGIRGNHLQKRFTSLSTAGVNWGIAVNSWAASFGYFCPPAGKFMDARLNASRAVRARSQLRLSLAAIVAVWPTENALAPSRNLASADV